LIFKGKHTGDFIGIPATNKMVDLAGVALLEMKNGKIAQEEDFMDNMMFMGQLGVLSDPNNMIVIVPLFKAFVTGTKPTVLGLMDENVVWNEAESNSLSDDNPCIGPKAVLNGVITRIVGL
jgi:ketosteroid isomerase-like protein